VQYLRIVHTDDMCGNLGPLPCSTLALGESGILSSPVLTSGIADRDTLQLSASSTATLWFGRRSARFYVPER
jgi:hypothetical protein